MPNKRHDLTGKRYGRLAVLIFVERHGNHSKWLCQCDCGNQTNVLGCNLKTGMTQSCGCLKRELHTTHGHTAKKKSPEYEIWQAMHQRCKNPKLKQYKDYGGRNIKVCERWGAFQNFIFDMGTRPQKKLTLDRINNDLGYTPENCRWGTRKEQAANQRQRIRLDLYTDDQLIDELKKRTANDQALCAKIAKITSASNTEDTP